MLTVASLMTSAALEREETRGVHLRTDFPEPDDANWRRHITVGARTNSGQFFREKCWLSASNRPSAGGVSRV